jgi:hypothetical protein
MESRTLRFFEQMIKGMPASEITAVLECGKGQGGTYIFNVNDRSVRVPRAGEISWPVEYILAKLHRKHVLPLQTTPKIRDVNKSLTSWSNRVRWRWFFAGRDVMQNPFRYMWSKPIFATPCDQDIPLHVERYISEVMGEVFESCFRARVRYRHHPVKVPGLVKLGLNLLKESKWGTLLRTKTVVMSS